MQTLKSSNPFGSFTIAAIIALLVIGSGCASNPKTGPALLRLGVFTLAASQLDANPQSRVPVAAGAEIICAVAKDQTASVTNLVTELDAHGGWSVQDYLILNGIVGAINLAVSADTNSPAFSYLEAACGGLTDALTLTAPRARSSFRNAPPALKVNGPMMKRP